MSTLTTTKHSNDNTAYTNIEVAHNEGQLKVENNEDKKDQSKSEEEDRLGGPRFCPALYIQRYGFIREILDKHHITSVVDYGCAECKVLTLIKTVQSLQKILLVDIDEKLLESREYCIRPSLEEFLHHRNNPLHIQLLAGSAAILDERIVGIEAVTLVEVIEHLKDDVLNSVTENIFNNLHPRLVIITTPNSDFNILFPGFTGFRHWDHQFEWNRQEFQTWCNEVCCKYNYSVEITGIGQPPDDNQHVGYCSQAAIFTSLATDRRSTQIPSSDYKLISEYHYPYKEKKLTIEEELDIEVLYYIRQQCLLVWNDQTEESTITIPTSHLLNIKFVRTLQDGEFFRKYLEKKFNVTPDSNHITINITDYIQTDHDSSDNNCDDHDLDDVIESCDSNHVNTVEGEEEPDWD